MRDVSMAVQERAWSVVVPHHAGGARMARQQLAIELSELIAPGLLNDVVAVLAELLGNAVRHADPLPGGIIRLVVRVGTAQTTNGNHSSYVLLRVTDGGADGPPTAREASPDSMDGRGLAIVAALASRWGVEHEPEGQCVWAELGPAQVHGQRHRAPALDDVAGQLASDPASDTAGRAKA
jgi:anti-sigma regulatory factor (Ser/Thr protein kinase)